MNKVINQYEQLVIDIITIKTGEDKVWQKISYHNIEEAARYIEYAVELAMKKTRMVDKEI